MQRRRHQTNRCDSPHWACVLIASDLRDLREKLRIVCVCGSHIGALVCVVQLTHRAQTEIRVCAHTWCIWL